MCLAEKNFICQRIRCFYAIQYSTPVAVLERGERTHYILLYSLSFVERYIDDLQETAVVLKDIVKSVNLPKLV